MSAKETVQTGAVGLAAAAVIVILALWIIPYLVERFGTPRFTRESARLAAAEADGWAQYRETGVWPWSATVTPQRRWTVSEVVTAPARWIAWAALGIWKVGRRG